MLRFLKSKLLLLYVAMFYCRFFILPQSSEPLTTADYLDNASFSQDLTAKNISPGAADTIPSTRLTKT